MPLILFPVFLLVMLAEIFHFLTDNLLFRDIQTSNSIFFKITGTKVKNLDTNLKSYT
jgi:hypothetical protein